ncbi:MAG TPA: penicillin acylase family protein, partial [bacterium]
MKSPIFKCSKRTSVKTLLVLVLTVGISWASPAFISSSQSSSDILWDNWGVPHIYAPNDAGLFKAFGWAQMHNHGKLLLHLYALARGRGAEFFGKDDLPSDRSVHLMGLYSLARQWY